MSLSELGGHVTQRAPAPDSGTFTMPEIKQLKLSWRVRMSAATIV